jgi:hypothetical protein
MVKLSGPMHSDGASGQFAGAMVFGVWKGINVCRQYVIPRNVMSSGQGDQRIMIGGTGRAVGKVAVDSAFAQQLIDLALIPGGQTKQSYLVKYIMDHYLIDATAYASEVAALTGHASYSDFGNSADDLGIVAFDLDYATIAEYNKALGLYLLAKTAIAIGFTGTPYTTALASWVTADIEGMVADMTGA